jgi:orotate phosphoribosyltransferase
MALFQLGDFTLRSGAQSAWKIECDALTPDDWAALARMAFEILPPFCTAAGVPRGGVPFAKALEHYSTGNGIHPVLVAEDVCTTGGSMEKFRADLTTKTEGGVIGVCVFARQRMWPDWVRPLFAFNVRDE